MIPTRQRIAEALDQLAAEAWESRDVAGAVDRYHEIRQLTREQLVDDADHQATPDRIGRHWVKHYEPLDDDGYRERTFMIDKPVYGEDQLNLQAGIQGYLDQLTGEERALVLWAFDGRNSLREIAKWMHVSHMTVSRRLTAVQQRLRLAIGRDLLSEGDEEER